MLFHVLTVVCRPEGYTRGSGGPAKVAAVSCPIPSVENVFSPTSRSGCEAENRDIEAERNSMSTYIWRGIM